MVVLSACSSLPQTPARIEQEPWPESQRIRWTRGEIDHPCSFLGPDRPFDRPKRSPEFPTVASLAGAPVARIAAKQLDPGLLNSRPIWADVEQRVQRVWSSKPGSLAVEIDWAESFQWEIVAILEFTGSDKRGCLATDGSHVNVRDIDGRSWYTRVPR